VEVTIDRSALAPGMNHLGLIEVIASSGEGIPVPGSPTYIELSVYFGTLSEILLPVMSR
jgi:hypothetical protein